jgi:RIO kinase 1
MYNECKLVHADLSEYNILYHDSHLYIIDVSQSVEHDHPHAFDFLRNDVKNTEEYFGRRGVAALGLRRCFEFVTRETFEADGEAGLSDSEVLKLWLERPPPDITSADGNGEGDEDGGRAIGLDAQQEDSVFLNSYIPRTLNEVYDPERDLEALKRGAKIIYSNTIGVVNPKPEATTLRAEEDQVPIEGEKKPKVHFSADIELEDETQSADEDEDEGDDDENEGDEEGEEGEGGGEPRERKPRGPKHVDKEAKKVIRRAVSVASAWLTILTLGTQKSREGGTAREAQSQDAQVGEEETDKDHCQQTIRCIPLAVSLPSFSTFSYSLTMEYVVEAYISN